MPKKPFVPPGGFAGFAPQTIATKQLLVGAVKPRRKATRKKRVTKKTPVKRARRTPGPVGPKRKRITATRKKRAHLVKGSAAAKRHMAKLRRMRKR